MRGYVLSGYGGPDRASLGEVPAPVPGPGEVPVRVHAAGLNPVDFKTREGQLRLVQRYRLPIVLGNELAGVVERDGAGFRAGERVFARLPKARMGAFADHAVVPAELLARVPDGLDLPAAAGVPLAGLTALQALRDELGVGPGFRVFIPGGAGGVGTFAIPIAKWLGAHVTTTASSRGRALVERLGADIVVDYTTQDVAAAVRGMDGAFDLVGGDTLVQAFGAVKPGGTVVSIAGLPEPVTARKDLRRGPALAALFWLASLRLRAQARRHGVRYRYLFMHPSGRELAELAALIEAGTLAPVIDRVFPFADIGEAFAYLEGGRAKGKVVVRMVE